MNSIFTVIEQSQTIDTNHQDGTAATCRKSSATDHLQQHHLFTKNHDDMSKTTDEKTIGICEKATNRIIELLEHSEVAWRRTWGTYGYARNFKTKHVYTGVNMFFLNLLSPHPIPYYLTFRQAKELGGKIKKGAKSEKVFFYKSYYKDEDGKPIKETDLKLPKYDNQELETVRFLKHYSVFNIEDTEGIDWEKPEAVNRPNNPIEECEVIITEMPERPAFELVDANKAFYDPIADIVNVPDIKQFENSGFYYRTTFHEIAHWTGHEKRLARPGITQTIEPGSDRYAEEELVAELTSNFLLNIAGVSSSDTQEVSAGYLQSWITRLKGDPKLIFRVAPRAQEAVEFILGKAVTELPL